MFCPTNYQPTRTRELCCGLQNTIGITNKDVLKIPYVGWTGAYPSCLQARKTLDDVPACRRSHVQRQTTIHTHIHQSMSLDCVLGSQSAWREIPPENSQWWNWADQPLLRYSLQEMWVEIPLKCFLFSCAGRQCQDEHYAGLRRRPCSNLLQRQRHWGRHQARLQRCGDLPRDCHWGE